jgi:Glycosyltransferase family 87
MPEIEELKYRTTGAIHSKWMALCVVLLLLAAGEFLVRGPVRAVQTATQFNDFLSPYIQAEAWVHGLDPYSPQVLLRLWPPQAPHYLFLPKEVAAGTLVAKRGFPTAYPITALALISPFSVLPWNVAYALWLSVNVALFAVMLLALLGLAGFSYRESDRKPQMILLAAATLALAPFHTGVVTANVTLVAVELSVIAIWMARRNWDLATGLLLGVAVGLKPQIGLCFLFYYLLRRRWKIFGIALALLACLTAAGLLRLEISHTPWLANYVGDNRILLETGVLGNFTAINPTRFGLINLQVALYPPLGDVSLTNDLGRVIGAILLATWFVGFGRGRRSKDGRDYELLELSAIAIISVLPIYHRFYDATLLILPLCWAFASFQRAQGFALVYFLLMIPFLVPGGTILETLVASGRIPASLAQTVWWQALIMSHQVWLLLLLCVTLLSQMMWESRNLGNEYS